MCPCAVMDCIWYGCCTKEGANKCGAECLKRSRPAPSMKLEQFKGEPGVILK